MRPTPSGCHRLIVGNTPVETSTTSPIAKRTALYVIRWWYSATMSKEGPWAFIVAIRFFHIYSLLVNIRKILVRGERKSRVWANISLAFETPFRKMRPLLRKTASFISAQITKTKQGR